MTISKTIPNELTKQYNTTTKVRSESDYKVPHAVLHLTLGQLFSSVKKKHYNNSCCDVQRGNFKRNFTANFITTELYFGNSILLINLNNYFS